MTKRISISQLADIDIERVKKEDLVDVSGLTFDYALPQEQRAAWIFETINNPYCFRVGDVGVKLEFTESAPTLHELFTNFLIRQKSGL